MSVKEQLISIAEAAEAMYAHFKDEPKQKPAVDAEEIEKRRLEDEEKLKTVRAATKSLCDTAVLLYDQVAANESQREDFAQLMILTGKLEGIFAHEVTTSATPLTAAMQIARKARALAKQQS